MSERVRRHVLVPEQEMLRKAQLQAMPAEAKSAVQTDQRMRNALNAKHLPMNVKALIFGDLLQRYRTLQKQLHTLIQPAPAVDATATTRRTVSTGIQSDEPFNEIEDKNFDDAVSHLLDEVPVAVADDDAGATTVPKTLRAIPQRLPVPMITQAMPAKYQNQTNRLLNYIMVKGDRSFTWNAKGEVVADGETRTGSNIVDLLKFVARPPHIGRKGRIPSGFEVFRQKLLDFNVPLTLAPSLEAAAPAPTRRSVRVITGPSANKRQRLQNGMGRWIPYPVYKRGRGRK